MFDRVTGGPMFYVIRSTDDSLMIHCYSFTCETDGHLGISNGRLTDWAYCTIVFFYFFYKAQHLILINNKT